MPETSSLSMPRPCVFHLVSAWDQGLGFPGEGELRRGSFLVQGSFRLRYSEQGRSEAMSPTSSPLPLPGH